MRLSRCHEQTHGSLEAHFGSDDGEDPAVREAREAMRGLIKRIQDTPSRHQAWGLTSVMRLCLLAEDRSDSPWYVIVQVGGPGRYEIEYRMPDDVAPWPEAYVKGVARSEDEAVQKVFLAMEKSGGWK